MRRKVDHSEYYINLGRKLREIRENQKLSQKAVAVKLGISCQQYQKYESGENRIPTNSLVIFCELTNSDIKELTDFNINKEVENQNIKNDSFSSYSIAKLAYSNKKIRVFLEFDLNQKFVKGK